MKRVGLELEILKDILHLVKIGTMIYKKQFIQKFLTRDKYFFDRRICHESLLL